MLAKTTSYGISGLDAYPVTIEVDVTRGLPSTTIVGLPDNAIRESKERVRSAIRNSGYKYDPQRITINLSPADIKKEGPSFDLAIALGILAATAQVPTTHLKEFAYCGELSLDGRIQAIKGSLSTVLALSKSNLKGLVVPYANGEEAAIVEHIPIYPVHSLNEAVSLLCGPDSVQPLKSNGTNLLGENNHYEVDFNEIKGQNHAKRGLEIAAAGGHNVILIGPPGSGKSMLAKRFPTILPNMTFDEALETTKIHSALGHFNNTSGLITQRPFRSPHHTTSDVALVGGGSNPKPGEVTLSHNGVLFLDEFPEFSRNALEALRQPLEDSCVTISRANRAVKFPSKFTLLAAMNPCLCGWYTDPKKECHCTPNQIQKYTSKISGPLLDRIDIHLEVPSLRSSELFAPTTGEPSQTIKARTSNARQLQHKRFTNCSIIANSQMSHKQIKYFCPLSSESQQLLKTAIEELCLSARAYDKIIKIGQTISDLAGGREISTEHIAEAIQYRSLDRSWWG